MLQIKNTLGGGGAKVTIDGIQFKDNLNLVSEVMDLSASTLPYLFYSGSAVVFNGEIYILGSGDSNNYTKYYKWDGSSWTSVSTLPYNFVSGSAVVLNNEIHILGSGPSSSTETNHYIPQSKYYKEVA